MKTFANQLNCRIAVPDVSKLSRQEWLQIRRRSLGGSDISAALGLNRWRSPLEVWADKCGLPVKNEMSEACRWGILLEEPIRAELSRRNGWQIEKPSAMFQHRSIPFLTANVDGIALIPEKGRAIVEIKTGSSYKEQEWSDGQVPAEYLLQAQSYLDVLDLSCCVLACLLGGQKLIVTEVSRDSEMIDSIHRLAADFWDHVQNRIPPDPDGSDATAEFLAKLYPTSSNQSPMILAETADTIIEEWHKAKSDEEVAAEQRRLAESRLKTMLQDHEAGISPGGWRVSWKSVSTSRLDSARIKVEEPSIWTRYCTPTTSRRLSISAKK